MKVNGFGEFPLVKKRGLFFWNPEEMRPPFGRRKRRAVTGVPPVFFRPPGGGRFFVGAKKGPKKSPFPVWPPVLPRPSISTDRLRSRNRCRSGPRFRRAAPPFGEFLRRGERRAGKHVLCIEDRYIKAIENGFACIVTVNDFIKTCILRSFALMGKVVPPLNDV